MRVWGFGQSFHFTVFFLFLLKHCKQELEEIYCDQTQRQVSLEDLTSPKSKFVQPGSYQRSLSPLGGGGMGEMFCQSKVCKEFMDDKFEEVSRLLLALHM